MLPVLKRIETILEEKNLSRSWLAKRIGKSPSVIGSWFERDTFPKTQDLMNISNALHCSLDYLITGQEMNARAVSPDIEEAVRLLETLTPELRSVAIKQIKALVESMGVDGNSKHRETG